MSGSKLGLDRQHGPAWPRTSRAAPAYPRHRAVCPALDAFIERLGAEPDYAERVRIMRDELGPWLQEYVPAVSIGATHSIVGTGSRVGEWPLIPGHIGLHNWEYVTRVR